MGGTILFGRKSYIWVIIHSSSKISKFCKFNRGSKIHRKIFGTRRCGKYENVYFLEVWEKDGHLRKDTDMYVR